MRPCLTLRTPPIIQRVLAIPPKRFDRHVLTYLSDPEIDALLAAPDPTTWTGRRDHALLAVAIQTGLRVSELTSLTPADLHMGTGAHVTCLGKGRKQRVTLLDTSTVSTLRDWLEERTGTPTEPLFPTRRGGRLSPDAVQARLTRHATTAAIHRPTITGKKITPHVLRHSTAMRLLASGVDITVIALWLGHESFCTTEVYIHADIAMKELALARTTPADIAPTRYRPPDKIIVFLDNL